MNDLDSIGRRRELGAPDLLRALDSLRQCVVIRDHELAIVYTNPAARSAFGITDQHELDIDSIRSWKILDEKGEPVNMPIQSVVSEGRSWHGLIYQVHREGKPVQWFESEARPFKLPGGRVGVISVFTDITIQHELRLRTEGDERYFRSIAANANDLMWRSDEGNRIVWVSESVRTVLGYEPEEVIGNEILRLVHPDDQALAREARTTASIGESAGAQVRVRRHDGQWRYLSVRANAFIEPDGTVNGFFATARDVTVEAIVQIELQRSEEHLRSIAAMNDALSGELNVGEVCQRAADVFAFRIGESAVILLLDPNRAFLEPIASAHIDPASRAALQEFLGAAPFAVADTLSAHVIGSEESILASPQSVNAEDSDLARRFAEYLDATGTGSGIISPVIVDGSVIGVIALGRPSTQSPFVNSDREIADELVGLVALAVRAAQLRDELSDAERKFRLIAENASDVVVQLSLDGRHEWVSPSVVATLGWTPAELLELTGEDVTHPDDVQAVRTHFEGLKRGDVIHHQFRFRCKDDSFRWVEATIRLATGPDDETPSVIASLRDVERERASRAALAQSEEMFRLGMASAPIGMAIVDLDGMFVKANDSLCSIVGYTEAELIGKSFQDITHPDDLEEDLELARQLVANEISSYTLEKRYIRSDGSSVWIELRGSVIRSDSGEPQFFIAQIVDIDEIRKARTSLEFRAEHDALTGALNRKALLDRMGATVVGTQSTASAVLYCDIDFFKDVNDTFGHEVGDEVLRRVVGRMTDRLRGNDLVARVGGDEFVIVIAGLPASETARRIGESIRSEVRQQMSINGVRIELSMSIGVAHPRPGEDSREVIRRADEALYQAKRQGRDRIVFAPNPD